MDIAVGSKFLFGGGGGHRIPGEMGGLAYTVGDVPGTLVPTNRLAFRCLIVRVNVTTLFLSERVVVELLESLEISFHWSRDLTSLYPPSVNLQMMPREAVPHVVASIRA